LYLSMECPNCFQSYEGALSNGDQSAVPRILSKCGHSLCHSCVVKFYQNKKVQCPICGIANIAESIQMFAKNLALMQLMVESQDGSSKSSSRLPRSPSGSASKENECVSSSSKSGSGASKLEISVYTNHQAYSMGV
jgi:zinc-RING finger domain